MIIDIFNDAWSDNWGFVPATQKEVAKAAKDLSMILMPEITRISFINGEAAAVALGIPNVNELIRDLRGKLFPFGFIKMLWRLKVQGPKSGRLLILGIRKKWRHVRRYGGLSAYLYVEMNRSAHLLGMKTSELGWTLEDNADAISKQFTFRDFPEAVLFVSALVPGAEEADHHPDVIISYKRVTLVYSTHSEGGLTDKDFDGARMADRVAANLPDLESYTSD